MRGEGRPAAAAAWLELRVEGEREREERDDGICAAVCGGLGCFGLESDRAIDNSARRCLCRAELVPFLRKFFVGGKEKLSSAARATAAERLNPSFFGAAVVTVLTFAG